MKSLGRNLPPFDGSGAKMTFSNLLRGILRRGSRNSLARPCQLQGGHFVDTPLIRARRYARLVESFSRNLFTSRTCRMRRRHGSALIFFHFCLNIPTKERAYTPHDSANRMCQVSDVSCCKRLRFRDGNRRKLRYYAKFRQRVKVSAF